MVGSVRIRPGCATNWTDFLLLFFFFRKGVQQVDIFSNRCRRGRGKSHGAKGWGGEERESKKTSCCSPSLFLRLVNRTLIMDCLGGRYCGTPFARVDLVTFIIQNTNIRPGEPIIFHGRPSETRARRTEKKLQSNGFYKSCKAKKKKSRTYPGDKFIGTPRRV